MKRTHKEYLIALSCNTKGQDNAPSTLPLPPQLLTRHLSMIGAVKSSWQIAHVLLHAESSSLEAVVPYICREGVKLFTSTSSSSGQ